MPLYFFHLRTPAGLDRDAEGILFPDLETAYIDTCIAIFGLSAELTRNGLRPSEHTFEIADADDTPLLEVPFAATLRDTRRLTRSACEARHLSLPDRREDLATLVEHEVQTIRGQVRASREWVEQACDKLGL